MNTGECGELGGLFQVVGLGGVDRSTGHRDIDGDAAVVDPLVEYPRGPLARCGPAWQGLVHAAQGLDILDVVGLEQVPPLRRVLWGPETPVPGGRTEVPDQVCPGLVLLLTAEPPGHTLEFHRETVLGGQRHRVIEQLGVDVGPRPESQQSTETHPLEGAILRDDGVAPRDPPLDDAAHVRLIEYKLDRAVLDGVGEHQDTEVWIGCVSVDVRLA